MLSVVLCVVAVGGGAVGPIENTETKRYVCMYAVVGVVVAAAAAAAAVIIVIDGRFVVSLWRSGVRVRCGCCGFCQYSI